jgi:FtsZ-binding cell division protein ZapB
MDRVGLQHGDSSKLKKWSKDELNTEVIKLSEKNENLSQRINHLMLQNVNFQDHINEMHLQKTIPDDVRRKIGKKGICKIKRKIIQMRMIFPK